VEGHDAMSCNILETEQPGPHYTRAIHDILGHGWDLITTEFGKRMKPIIAEESVEELAEKFLKRYPNLPNPEQQPAIFEYHARMFLYYHLGKNKS
jgi:hypothetical protein